MDLTNMDDVMDFMREARGNNEWRRRCEKVKRANKGKYPEFWYEAVIQSGIRDKAFEWDDDGKEKK